MSISQSGGTKQLAEGGNWHEVRTLKTDCPICGKGDWCSMTEDGAAAMCRRVDFNPSGRHELVKEGTDRNGEPYWIYQLEESKARPRATARTKKDEAYHGTPDYIYRDPGGEALFGVLRTRDKRFPQVRSDGAGGWLWGLDGIPTVPYRLPEVIDAVQNGKTVFVTEGEKDVHTLISLGLEATCNPMGAGKWRPEYGQHLTGANVVILADMDRPGWEHADKVAQMLQGNAESIKIIKEWPGFEFREKNGADVTDWTEAGGTKEALLQMVGQAETVGPNPADRFFDGKSFNHMRLAEDIMDRYNFRHCYQDFWIYDNGVYRPEGEKVIEQETQRLLGQRSSRYRINEVKNFIKIASYADPMEPSKELINLKNGRLNWRTGELLPHNPNNFEITQLPVEYDPEAECPQFERYLETTLDPDVIPLILEVMGYCLIPDTSFEKTVMLVGEGANGKGVFLDLMTYLLGRENVLGAELQELVDNRFRAAELLGKLANISADIGSHRMENTGRFKMLVSGDFLQVERKHQDPFNFRNHARLLFSANEIPGSRDRTYAYYRRWIIIPFTRTFKGQQADKNLRDKLRSELPGIFNKALAGLRRLIDNNEFTQPEQVKDQLEEYKRENNNVAAFVAERCVEDPNSYIIKQKLYAEYKEWCTAQGLNPFPQKSPAYKNALCDAIDTVDEFRTNRGSGPWAWKGIRLL